VAALAGSGLAVLASLLLVENLLNEGIASQFALSNLVTSADVWSLAPFVFGVGAILAILASGISTYRHVRI
jgi:cell division protein FtsX